MTGKKRPDPLHAAAIGIGIGLMVLAFVTFLYIRHWRT